ncbi:MAG TPA: efflux RND transporter periplasmic adaptor subunit [Bacillota bacterium]|nr:efflux RND transporter periplasmic adaptor subunit [Bacillota bacterium]
MSKKKLLIISSAVLFVLLIIGLNIYRNGQAETVTAQVFQVKQDKIEENVLVSGKVEAVSRQDVIARSNSQVEDVLVREGDKVKAGQLLLSLDTQELVRNVQREQANVAMQQANLAKAQGPSRPQEVAQDRAAVQRAQALYDAAKTKYERNQTLLQGGVISQETLDNSYTEFVGAQTELNSAKQRLSLRLAGDTRESLQALKAMVSQAQVALDLAEEQLAQAEVRAPLDGVVLSLEAEKGRYVTVGTVLATVGDTSRLRVKADVSESDGGSVQVGQQVKIKASALREEEFAGRVSQVGAAARTKTSGSGEETNVQVTVEITKFSERLKPGYTVDLTITTASRQSALLIPYDAVMEKNKLKEVFVVESGKAQKKTVATGFGNALYVTVDKGLKKGDKVIVSPSEQVKNGSVIKETPYEAEPANGDKKGD